MIAPSHIVAARNDPQVQAVFMDLLKRSIMVKNNGAAIWSRYERLIREKKHLEGGVGPHEQGRLEPSFPFAILRLWTDREHFSLDVRTRIRGVDHWNLTYEMTNPKLDRPRGFDGNGHPVFASCIWSIDDIAYVRRYIFVLLTYFLEQYDRIKEDRPADHWGDTLRLIDQLVQRNFEKIGEYGLELSHHFDFFANQYEIEALRHVYVALVCPDDLAEQERVRPYFICHTTIARREIWRRAYGTAYERKRQKLFKGLEFPIINNYRPHPYRLVHPFQNVCLDSDRVSRDFPHDRDFTKLETFLTGQATVVPETSRSAEPIIEVTLTHSVSPGLADPAPDSDQVADAMDFDDSPDLANQEPPSNAAEAIGLPAPVGSAGSIETSNQPDGSSHLGSTVEAPIPSNDDLIVEEPGSLDNNGAADPETMEEVTEDGDTTFVEEPVVVDQLPTTSSTLTRKRKADQLDAGNDGETMMERVIHHVCAVSMPMDKVNAVLDHASKLELAKLEAMNRSAERKAKMKIEADERLTGRFLSSIVKTAAEGKPLIPESMVTLIFREIKSTLGTAPEPTAPVTPATPATTAPPAPVQKATPPAQPVIEEQPDESWSFQALDVAALKHAFTQPIDTSPGNFKSVKQLIEGNSEINAFFQSIRPESRKARIFRAAEEIVVHWFDEVAAKEFIGGNSIENWSSMAISDSGESTRMYFHDLHTFVIVILKLFVFKRDPSGQVVRLFPVLILKLDPASLADRLSSLSLEPAPAMSNPRPLPEAFLKTFRAPVFTGKSRSSSVEDWLQQLEDYLDAAQVAPTHHIVAAKLCLKDQAYRWYRRQGFDEQSEGVFDDFKDRLRRRFGSPNAELIARDKLYSLVQRGSVTRYIEEFEDLSSQIEELGSADAMYLFQKGLKPKIREYIASNPDARKSLDVMMDVAENLDNVQYHGRQFYPQLAGGHRSHHVPARPPRPAPPARPMPEPMDVDVNAMEARGPPRSRFQQAATVSPKDRQKQEDLRHGSCFFCHRPGHQAKECPMKSGNGRPY
ncbi:uncharacterized protein BJ171DRAFT_597231 [Polychytrium aggregatum]|uniref:uncharacterized protein n=1 Tax=Polychytrium aggregatum TaxID=110093 RepID=UPI0022FE39A1|nr:uncharacterized protein BJ171DRAFT_597231 [Polychytrium aggregatum]KAI9206553.1 hypothetical protein BJ171DRAFT_597231 [Polychytrium aggregatum]